MRGYTQKELADRASMHETLIQQYEHERRKPKQEQIERIAGALEVDPAFLVPSKINISPFAVNAILFDIIEGYGDVSFTVENNKIYIGIDRGGKRTLDYEKLMRAMSAHEELSLEAFKKWLIDQPLIFHDGKFKEKDHASEE